MEYFNQWALYSYVDKWIIKDYSHIIYVHRHKYGRKYAMFMHQDQNITTKKALWIVLRPNSPNEKLGL